VIRPGASWCDLVKHADGRVEFVYLQGTTVICESADTGVRRWAVDAGRPLLYLRAAADGGGRVCALGQGHDDGQAHATIEGGPVFSLGSTHGVFPVLLFGTDDGWTLFVQGTANRYNVWRVLGNGAIAWSETVTMPPTSQGFLYVSHGGAPITQDRGRGAIPGLALPSPAPGGEVWVGQSMADNTLALFDGHTGAITTLNTPGGQPPHIVESDGTYYVCSYVDGGAWLSTHRRPFAAVTPPIEPPPVIPPPVDPGEPDMAVQDVPNYSSQLRDLAARNPTAFRNAHGDYDRQGQPGFLTEEQANEFIRIAAYELHQIDRGIGLNGKRASSTLSQDALCYRHSDGRESVIDVINGAGGSNPSIGWNVVGHYRTAGDGQRWIQPKAVSGGSQPPLNPGTPSPPVTPPPSTVTFPTGVEMPEDVSLGIINRYLQGIRERDKIHGETDTVPSRGALMYLQAVFFRELSSWIVQKKRAPQGTEWWAVGDQIAAAAVKHYQDRQGVD
jgi:hypothetical protein